MTRMLNMKDLYPDPDPGDFTAAMGCGCPGCARGHTAWYCSATGDPFADHGWRLMLAHTIYASLWPTTPLDRLDGLDEDDLSEMYVTVHESECLTMIGLCPACIDAGTHQPWLPPDKRG